MLPSTSRGNRLGISQFMNQADNVSTIKQKKMKTKNINRYLDIGLDADTELETDA